MAEHITHLRLVSIPVADVDRAKAFYVDVLGFEERFDGPFGEGTATTIRFATPEFGVAPGQAAVLYAGERVIGGGWIEATEAAV